MKFQVLKTDEELDRYRFATEKYIKVLLPLEYLKRSKVVAYVRDDGVICGGVILVKKGPFRVIDSIPDDAPNLLPVEKKDLAEITGLWLNNSMADSMMPSVSYWLKFYSILLTSKKKGFVYAYSMRKRHLQRLYANGNPTVLFRGATKMMEGMECAELESIEFLPWRNLFTGPFRKPQFLYKRMVSGFRRKLSVSRPASSQLESEDYSEEAVEIN